MITFHTVHPAVIAETMTQSIREHQGRVELRSREAKPSPELPGQWLTNGDNYCKLLCEINTRRK